MAKKKRGKRLWKKIFPIIIASLSLFGGVYWFMRGAFDIDLTEKLLTSGALSVPTLSAIFIFFGIGVFVSSIGTFAEIF